MVATAAAALLQGIGLCLRGGGVVVSNSDDRGKLSQSWVEGGAGSEGWEDY